MITIIIIKKDVTVVMEWFFVQIFGNLDVLLLSFFIFEENNFCFTVFEESLFAHIYVIVRARSLLI